MIDGLLNLAKILLLLGLDIVLIGVLAALVVALLVAGLQAGAEVKKMIANGRFRS